MVDAHRDLAEQAPAAVRVRDALSRVDAAYRVDILPDQGVRDTAVGYVREAFPAETAVQVASVQTVDHHLQTALRGRERSAQRLLQIHHRPVRLADGVQVAQDIEIAHRQRHAQMKRHAALVGQFILAEELKGFQLSGRAAEYQHQRAGAFGFHILEQRRLGAGSGLPHFRRDGQGHLRPGQLFLFAHSLPQTEGGPQILRFTAKQLRQAGEGHEGFV